MKTLSMTGLALCVAALLPACGDDDEGDDGVRNDGGTDAGTPLDAAFDAAQPKDSEVPTPVDAAIIDAASIDAGEVDAALRFIELTVQLTTAAEVPACANAGPSASGEARIRLPPADAGIVDAVAVDSVTWQNLSSAVTAAHIHFGAAGANGPVVLPFASVTPPVQQGFTGMEYVAAQGAPPSFAAFYQELKAGRAYLNVHTQSCPAGELRGQIVLP
jgi:hypothetical protein